MNAAGNIVRMGLIRRRKDLAADAFRRHWRGPHGTLAASMPGLVAYHQNHRTDAYPVEGCVDRWELDGLSQLWFASLDAMRAAVASPAYGPVATDTPDVMTMPGIIAGTQVARSSMTGSSSGDEKLMLLGTRVAEIPAGEFAERWNGAALLPGLSAMARSVDTFVTHRESRPGVEVGWSELPLDVVTEFFFSKPAALSAVAEALADQLLGRAGEVLSGAALYRTRTHVVVDQCKGIETDGQ